VLQATKRPWCRKIKIAPVPSEGCDEGMLCGHWWCDHWWREGMPSVSAGRDVTASDPRQQLTGKWWARG